MSDSVHEFGRFRFLPAARELWRGDRRVELPRRTFECLDYLIAHRDRAVGRDELVTAVFHRPDVSDAQLGQVVLRTRRAVDDDGNAQNAIRTIAGFGYRWIACTESRAAVAPASSSAAIDATGAGQSVPAGAARRDGDTRPPLLSSEAAFEPAHHDVPPVGLPVAMAARRRRARAMVVALAVGALIVTGAAMLSRLPRAPVQRAAVAADADRTVVLPLDIDGLREDGWVRLGAMDLVADRLREAGLRVPPSENVIGLLTSTTPSPQAGQLRSLTGAQLLVRGRATHEAAGWRVDLAAAPAQGLPVPVSASAPDAMQAARAAADQLLAALGHSLPAAIERDVALNDTLQRARAAMLANELDTARSILHGSALLARRPDQLAFQLSTVDFRAGRLDAAEAALDGVLAHASTATDTDFHAQVLTARGSTRMRRGAFEQGGRDFDAALALLGANGPALERGRAQLGRANTRVAAHRYDEALADFGAARVALESAGDALGVTRVDANLGMLELYRGRPASALGYLSGAADRFQSFGALHELLLTLTGLMQAQLALLQHDAAWATVERATALRARITDPDQRTDLLLDRAEVLLGVGRYHEAGDALDQANRIATSGNRVLLARSRWLMTRLSMCEEQWARAAAAAGQALAEWPVSGADGDRAGVVLLRQRALLALGRDGEARALLDRARAVPRVVEGAPGEIDDGLAMAEWMLHESKADVAAAWYRFALASAERSAVPARMVEVARSQTPHLLATGAHEAAVAVVGRVAPWSGQDFDSALLQLALFHALAQHDAWFHALRQVQALAGERTIPPALMTFGSGGAAATLRLGAVP